jgi:hypothetical protein
MLEILEREQRSIDDAVVRPLRQFGDESDTAGIVLVFGVVEANGLWWLHLVHGSGVPDGRREH